MKRNAKPSSGGSSSGRGSRLRLTLLLATAAAFLLVPAAQASAAAGSTTLNVNIEGPGSGEVNSHVGFFEFFKGVPEIECSGPPTSGTCEDKMSVEEFAPEFEAVALGVGVGVVKEWTVEGALFFEGCEPGVGGCAIFVETGTVAEVEVTVKFAPSFPLTLEKLPAGTGEGTVVSSPGGIVCTPECLTKTASFEAGALVTLTANQAEGSVFTSWSGCVKTVEGTGAKGRKCTVQMSKALTVKAKFTKVQKITAKKDSEGNGFGTLTSAPGGISCGPACTQATALFTDSSTVTLKATAVASTSQFAGWTVCPGTEEEEGKKCKVVASEAKSATAKFNLIQQFALTITKPVDVIKGIGTGTVSSSPAGISCGPTCFDGGAGGPLAVAGYNKNKEVTLKEVPALGSTFAGWTGDCGGTGECKVTMSAAKSVGAIFE